MNIQTEVRAAVSAGKQTALLFIAGALLISGYIAIDTKGFTQKPTWWKMGVEQAEPVLGQYAKTPTKS